MTISHFDPFTVSNAPLRVGRQKYSCVFLAMSAKRKLTKEKKRRKKKKKIYLFLPFFCVSYPFSGNHAKPTAAPLHVFMIWLFISFFYPFFFFLPDSIRILFLLRRFRSCPCLLEAPLRTFEAFSGSAIMTITILPVFILLFFFFNSHYPGFGFSPDSFLPDRFFDLLHPLVLYFFNFTFSSAMALIPFDLVPFICSL